MLCGDVSLGMLSLFHPQDVNRKELKAKLPACPRKANAPAAIFSRTVFRPRYGGITNCNLQTRIHRLYPGDSLLRPNTAFRRNFLETVKR